ncbi:MAG: hypothetical protein ABR524_08655 [Thermoanaerobaculia bacterium]
MTPLLLISLLFGGVAPAAQTAWMTPERFHLELGMSLAQAEAAIVHAGLVSKEGKEPGHRLVEVSEKRMITLAFEDDCLTSIRFELVDFLPEIRTAWKEIVLRMFSAHGKPSRQTESPRTLVYEGGDPEIYIFASVEPKGAFGEQGLGFLVTRYVMSR